MYYTVRAYNWVDGKFELAAFADGFAYRQARAYFSELSNSNAFAQVRMTKMELV